MGLNSKKLKDFPEKERALWRDFDNTPFEDHIAAENLTAEDVLKFIDYPAYFQLIDKPLPENRNQILESLKADSIIKNSEINKWNILNLGATLFARNLKDFKTLQRKTVRIIHYQDNDRSGTSSREYEETSGYACGFNKLMSYIENLLLSNEIIEQAQRKLTSMYPSLAIRELIANALIHQYFFITGAGPMIEIFQDRIEITNPGKPLIETLRLLDSPPRSRNESLASLMRRIGLCEERGSGIDKVISQTELHYLPAPVFETVEDNMRVVLFAYRSMKRMNKKNRIHACYMHACLKYVTGDQMTNSRLRERFRIEQKNSAEVSRVIKATIEAELILPYDPNTAKKHAKYVPFWVNKE